MSKPSYPSIPEPTPTIEGILPAVQSLKMAVELLTGQQSGVSFGAPRVFVQPSQPLTGDKGDLWIVEQSNKLHWYTGSQWVALT